MNVQFVSFSHLIIDCTVVSYLSLYCLSREHDISIAYKLCMHTIFPRLDILGVLSWNAEPNFPDFC